MKVTIITNGQQQLVLKPENKFDSITLESLNGKILEATHYDKPTQILSESYPDCLVLGRSNSTSEKTAYMAVIDCESQNKILGLIPANTSQENILSFITHITKSELTEVSKRGHTIVINESFKVRRSVMMDEQSSSVFDGEYAVVTVDTFEKW